MKNTLKVAIIILILVVISVILFITGKRHDILIENNSSTGIKYSINGEPYKILDTVIFIKTNDDKVIEKDLPSDDINIFINEIINNSENWYKENTENQ